MNDQRLEYESKPEEVVRETQDQRIAVIFTAIEAVSLAEARTPFDSTDTSTLLTSSRLVDVGRTPTESDSSVVVLPPELNMTQIQQSIDEAFRRAS